MLRGYSQAAITLNLLRAFTQGGFADLHRVQQWNQAFVAASPQGERYAALARRDRGIAGFMTACGMIPRACRNCARRIYTATTRCCSPTRRRWRGRTA